MQPITIVTTRSGMMNVYFSESGDFFNLWYVHYYWWQWCVAID